MKSKEYFYKLDEMFYHYFDLYLNKDLAGRQFDLYGYCRMDNEKYIATRSVKIWEFIDYEHVMVKISDKFLIDNFSKNFLDKLVEELVNPHSNHHQSYLTLVSIVNAEVNKENINWINKFKYSKSFLFGIRGWCDIRLIVVDIISDFIYTNQAGEKIVESYLHGNLKRYKKR